MGRAIASAILEYRNAIRSNSTSLTASIPGNTPDAGEQPETTVDKDVEEAVEAVSNPGEIKDAALEVEKMPEEKEAVITPPVESPTEQKEVVKGPEKEPVKKEVEQAPVKIESQQAAKNTGDSGIVFKVQLMAVTKDIPLTPSNFKGLNTLSRERYKNMYRILYGSTQSYEQAKLLQAGAKQKGYSQAYIVAYREGERIPVKKALQYLSN
jgi:N-acetylmuramoyl-L-alanine amidase